MVQGHCHFFSWALAKPLFASLSLPHRKEFISAAAKSVGKMSKQHAALALPARQISLGPDGAFRQRFHGL